MDITNLIIFIAVGLLVVAQTIALVRQRITIHNTKVTLLDTMVVKNAAFEELSKALEDNEKMKLEKSDGFVKFLSDSRDWAFEYIEDVQEEISEFDKLLTQIVEWNRTYGSVIGDIPHSEKIEQLSVEFKKLKDMLPQDKTPNN